MDYLYQFQDRTTATVQDSTDDLWFVEEESFAVEVNSDGEFSVEYDVESEKSQLSDSDISSIKSGQVKYCKSPKFSDTQNVCCNQPKIQTKRFFQNMQIELQTVQTLIRLLN